MGPSAYPAPPRKFKQVVIAGGGTKSAVLDTEHYKIGALHFDSDFAGTAISFEASTNGQGDGTFQQVDDDGGTQITMTVAASKSIPIHAESPAMALAGFRFLKIVSGTAQGGGTPTTIGVELVA